MLHLGSCRPIVVLTATRDRVGSYCTVLWGFDRLFIILYCVVATCIVLHCALCCHEIVLTVLLHSLGLYRTELRVFLIGCSIFDYVLLCTALYFPKSYVVLPSHLAASHLMYSGVDRHCIEGFLGCCTLFDRASIL